MKKQIYLLLFAMLLIGNGLIVHKNSDYISNRYRDSSISNIIFNKFIEGIDLGKAD